MKCKKVEGRILKWLYKKERKKKMEVYLKVDFKKSDEKLKEALEAYKKFSILMMEFQELVREEGLVVITKN